MPTIRALNKPINQKKTNSTDKKEAAPRARNAQARKPRASSRSTRAGVADNATAAPSETGWKRMDLHLHTPASHDYEQPDKSYLDILKQAERRGLDMIAFTDHNTVNGYRLMQREIEDLELLERLGRIRPDELGRLNEYRRLLKKIQVLPGFEFTATFGFHILGVFPPEKPIRDIERVLLDLKVPTRVIDKGLTEAGATSDVLEAYKRIDEAGGMAIAAHANSSAGVAMRDLRLGGQTRIAFTQDPHLRAIEFTDLDKGGRSSSRLFTGIRAEYPRRMHLIQGSDAHRVVADGASSRPGVGDRATEVQVEELTFESLRAIFMGEDFDHIRPAGEALNVQPDILQMARAAGEGPTVSFVPNLAKKAEAFDDILNHVTAMANGEGGYVFVGCDAKPSARKVSGLKDALVVSEELGEAITKRIFPIPYVTVDLQPGDKGADIIRVSVPRSLVAPHAIDNLSILIRDGALSRPATRDEIMAIARRVLEPQIAVQIAAQQPQQRDPLPPQRDQRQGGGFGRGAQQQSQQQHRGGQQQQQRGGPPREGRPQQQGGGQQSRSGQSFRDGQQGGQREIRQPLQRREHLPRHGQGQPGAPRGGQPPPSTAAYPRDEEAEPLLARPPIHVEEEAAPALDMATQVAPADEGEDATRAAQAGQAAAPLTPVLPPAEGAPRTGVEIAGVDIRDGIRYFTLRDLRNGSLVRNVTFKSARDLWHYALKQHATGAYAPDKISWSDDRAILARSERAGKLRYDLALRDAEGAAHVFYGVIEDGLDERWQTLLIAAGAHSTSEPASAGSEPEPQFELPSEPQSEPLPEPEPETPSGGFDGDAN